MGSAYFVRAVAVLTLAWTSAFAADLDNEGPGQAPSATVRRVHSQKISDRLSYPAQVRSRINATFVSDIDGVVKKITTPLGKAVANGQRLMTIENSDPAYNFKPMVVRAPVAGVVSSLEVTEGTRVMKGQRLGAVTDPRKIRIMIEVSGADLKSVSPGLEGSYAPSSGAAPIAVRVVGLSPALDAVTGTATAELDTLPGATAPSLGDLGQVSFEVNERNSYLVPESAIVYRKKETFIRVVHAGKVKWQPVKLGTAGAGRADSSEGIEVTSGLQEDQIIIESASGFVEDGGKIVVRNPAAIK
jgi:multidrug efflux pump subunit AcrA (membrane-fusion protein)